eukprot:gene9191-biopygen9479
MTCGLKRWEACGHACSWGNRKTDAPRTRHVRAGLPVVLVREKLICPAGPGCERPNICPCVRASVCPSETCYVLYTRADDLLLAATACSAADDP